MGRARTLSAALVPALLTLLGWAAPAVAAERPVVDEIAYFAPKLTDGRLTLGIHHGTYADNGEAWSPLDAVILHVEPEAKTTIPDPSFAAIGPVGADVWLTKTDPQAAGTLGIGYTTQELVGQALSSSRDRNQPTLTLHAVSGPGKAYSYTEGTEGTVFSYIYDLDAGVSTWTRGINANRLGSIPWAFTAQGYYCLDFESVVHPVEGGVQSDRRALTVAVGAVDPAAAPECQLDASQTAVSLDAAPRQQQQAGQPVTFTATTTPSGTAGTVQFYDGTTPLGEPLAVSNGRADLTTSALAARSHRISATFVPADAAAFSQSTSLPLDYGVYAADAFVFGAGSHADVAARLQDGRLELGLRKSNRSDGGNVSWHAMDASVIAVPDLSKVTLPDDARFAFLGEPGDTLYRIPLIGREDMVWLGMSGEALNAGLLQRTVAWTLDGFTGPGDAIVWNADAGFGARPLFSTRRGVPDGTTLPYSAHVHGYWDFTAAGVYCLGMTARTVLADGTAVKDRRTLTVVVGDALDPYATRPCEPVAPGAHGAPADATGDHAPRALTSAFADLDVRLDDGALAARLLDGDQRGPGTLRSLDDVVIPASTAGRIAPGTFTRAPWAGPLGMPTWELQQSGDRRLGFSTLALGDDAQLTWTLVDVRGPGHLVIHDALGVEHATPLLSSRPGHAVGAYALQPGRADQATWVFDQPGVYCVRMRWSGTAAGGAALADEHTLTFVAGERSPATVTPCAHGGRPDAPSAGRTVLDVGHVDVFGTVAGGAVTLSIRDGRDPVDVVQRPLQDVVLHASEQARTRVPADDRYRFLGAAGADVWVLPETQDPRLLWPGWSLSGVDALRWSLTGVRGPGQFVLYDSGGDSWGAPRVIFDSADGLPDAWTFSAHAHGAWAFSAPGVYCLDMAMEATAATRAAGTLLVAVGDVDPAGATEADCDREPPATGEPEPDEHTAPPSVQTPPSIVTPPAILPPSAPAAVALKVKRPTSATLRLRRLVRVGSFGVGCRLDVAGRCRVRATVTAATARRLRLHVARGAKTVTIGRASAAAGPRGRTVRVPLTRAARRALTRSRAAVRIRVELTATAAGRPTTSRTLTLKARAGGR